MIKVASVDVVPRNTLTELRMTSAVLGTENSREKGYIIGIIAHLKKNNYLTLCILMDFPIQVEYFKGSQVEITNYVRQSLMFVLIFTNSADPDEMQHYAAFHLGLQCLPEYQFRGFQYTKY